MKFMNQHYGQSRLFGRARFMAEPSGEGDNGIGENGGVGGTSDEGSNDDAGNDEPSIDEVKLQIARLQADLEKAKHANDKLAKSNKELTDKNRKYMTDEQRAQADREARDQELEELKREVRMSKYSKRLVGIGMTETEADELAGIIPELEDADTFFDTFGKFVESAKKAAGESAVQKLLKDRPDINAGNGEQRITVAEEKAQELAKRKAGLAGKEKIADYYKV